MSSLADVRLINEHIAPVKSLRSFTKQTRIPERAGDGDNRWVRQLAEADIDADLDEKFSSLRSAFGFKRREIQVGRPDEGVGVITTPQFNYEISLALSENDPAKIVWRRAVTGFQALSVAFGSAFEQVFGGDFSVLEVTVDQPLDVEAIVDNVEDAESQDVSVDYDKDVTWCEITLRDSLTSIRVTEQTMRATGPNHVKPRDLVESFLRVRDKFVQSVSAGENARG